ncbi:outer membrane beta-barrel protein [Helicobacter muridarum]|uniref:Outer membrane beta-barrel protein n=1 Tax=Helicobacter muridarum TaxID=216 RepID=A0A4V6I3J2_9HELI|nr:outer membrane beta-barrel protein [Helicobacter muridarum]
MGLLRGLLPVKKNNFAAIGAGFLVGYKFFFNGNIGLRAYVDSNFNFSGIEHCKLTKCETEWTNSFNDVAINIDLLWNFINLTNFSHGIALGVGPQFVFWNKKITFLEDSTLKVSAVFNIAYRLIYTKSRLAAEIGVKLPTSNQITYIDPNAKMNIVSRQFYLRFTGYF